MPEMSNPQLEQSLMGSENKWIMSDKGIYAFRWSSVVCD